jgi:hypothetical protein
MKFTQEAARDADQSGKRIVDMAMGEEEARCLVLAASALVGCVRAKPVTQRGLSGIMSGYALTR